MGTENINETCKNIINKYSKVESFDFEEMKCSEYTRLLNFNYDQNIETKYLFYNVKYSLEILYDKSDVKYFNNCIFYSEDCSKLKCNAHLIFINCLFINVDILKGHDKLLNFNISSFFENVRFDIIKAKQVIFTSCNFENIIINSNYNPKWHKNNNQKTTFFYVDECEYLGFYDSKIDNVYIGRPNSDNGELKFLFAIAQSPEIKSISVGNEKNLHRTSSEDYSNKIVFNKEFRLLNTRCDCLELYNVCFKSNVVLEVYSNNELTINSVMCEKFFEIEGDVFKNFSIIQSKFVEISNTAREYLKLEMEQNFFEKYIRGVKYDRSDIKVNDFSVKNCTFQKGVDFSNHHFTGSFLFSRNLIDKYLYFYNSIWDVFCKIEDSQITPSAFINFQQSKFLEGVDISDIKGCESYQFFGIKIEKFDDQEIIKKTYNSRKEDYYNSLKETYRIIKDSFRKQNNNITALEFHKQEMKIFNKSLSWKTNFGDKLMMCLNKCSNDYGLSYARALFFLLGVGFVTYLFMLLTVDLEFSFTSQSVGSFIFNYIKLLDITNLNKIQFYDQELNNVGTIIIFISKIFLAYAYYQFIQAFRKLKMN
jgi:hypothetical protein